MSNKFFLVCVNLCLCVCVKTVDLETGGGDFGTKFFVCVGLTT